MENELNGRQPQQMMTSMEDGLKRRRPQWKTTSMENGLNGRRPQLKNCCPILSNKTIFSLS